MKITPHIAIPNSGQKPAERSLSSAEHSKPLDQVSLSEPSEPKGWLGKTYERWSFDARATVGYLKRRATSEFRNVQDSWQSVELEPLSAKFKRANDAADENPRQYDGYDSSRDIVALYSQEGPQDQPYRFALELANLRPKAESVALDSELNLSFGKSELKLSIQDNQQIQVHGQALSPKKVKVGHSTRYNQIVVELDKEVLREAGWRDGTEMTIGAITKKPGEVETVDSVVASSVDNPVGQMFRWEGKTIYQILTDRYSNGDLSNDQAAVPGDPNRFHGGDWRGVIGQLDQLEELGVDCIWLSCPYENGRNFFGQDGYHGYWPQNFEKADPQFGDVKVLRELTDKAHAKGMKVMLDVVVNHTGYDHPFAKDPQKADWFHNEGGRSAFSQYLLEHGSLAGLPDLDQENPEVSKYLIDVHKQWLEDSNVDAYRVDAVRHVPDSFLREFNDAMRQKKEGFSTLAEVFWNDSHYISGYQNQAQDSLFDFPLMLAVRDVFGGDENLGFRGRIEQFKETRKHNDGLAWTELFQKGQSPMHKLSDVLKSDHSYDNPRRLSTILDNHDTGRFLSQCGGDKEKLKLASAFLFGARGTPSLYYGTETGMDGHMPHSRKDMDFEGDPELREYFKTLIVCRKSSPALQLGTQEELLVTDKTYAFTRVLPENEVLCLFNNDDQEQTLQVPTGKTQLKSGDRLADLLSEDGFQVVDDFVTVKLPPKSFRYLDWQKG